ncbi:MAG: hypothetical protein HWE25_13140 [Alphaproteobacteria bacterium]|nr:hypothetical protein [Alphaproteobacteria bacterium]
MTSKSFLTALSPIEFRHDDPDGTIAAIKTVLLTHEQENSPFRNCPMAHMVRLQVIDQLTPPMGDVSGASLKSRYLLFVADIDGSVDDFLDCLYRVNPEFVRSVWGRCLGYPGYDAAVFFRRYIHRCQFNNPLGYAGFPESVEDILGALRKKHLLAEWIAAHQGLDAASLQQAWQQSRASFIRPDTAKPGSLK